MCIAAFSVGGRRVAIGAQHEPESEEAKDQWTGVCAEEGWGAGVGG